MPDINYSSSVSVLHGVGEAKVKALSRLGINTLGDLLHHSPRGYQNRGAAVTVAEAAQRIRATGEVTPCAMILTVSSAPVVRQIRRGMSIMKLNAFDATGVCAITFFNQSFYRDKLTVGTELRFWGAPVIEYGKLQLNSPVFEPIVPGRTLDAVVPVYPLTHGLTQKQLSSMIKEALTLVLPELKDHIPARVLRENNICTLPYALENLHFPPDLAALEAARRRLGFDSIFCMSAALAMTKKRAYAPPMTDSDAAPLISSLPFALTGAQKRAINDICADMACETQMSRILCGDVGSGKTAVAAAAAYISVKNGFQCALMAPTEILAVQHYTELKPIFSRLGYCCVLLCGSLTASEKKKIRARLASSDGGADFVIGTHALLSEGVNFASLGLVITDEQHRFGVNQRAALKEKSQSAHMLVMSATPIPRTLSLALYGDLSMSVLDEMPPGRKRVGTFAVDESYRERLLGFIARQAQEGHRTYIVCPAVEPKAEDAESQFDIVFSEENAEPPMKAATEYAAQLREKLPQLRINFVHGKMKPAEKDAVMRSFYDGELDVLVSTTVIEVGVNVPQATLMIVENAERFGLSQLHQLRGRVGRGDAKSYCILVSDSKSEPARRRLETLCNTADGWRIAEEDLKMRGPGDFFAENGVIRQHGTSSGIAFAPAADGDSDIYENAARSAVETVAADPTLSLPENSPLKELLAQILSGMENTIN